MYKTCNVVMLPTNKKAHFGDIVLTPDNKPLFIFQHTNCTEVAQHLYITADEEIKESCWVYNLKGIGIDNQVFFVESNNAIYNCKQFNWKKIIATTDESLVLNNNTAFAKLLPQLSQQFIQYYIEEYNKGNIITKVEVEYTGGTKEISVPVGHEDYSKGLEYDPEKLKVNPDNTINIKPIKDNWNRSEVVELLIKAMIYANQYHSDELYEEDISDWIEENV